MPARVPLSLASAAFLLATVPLHADEELWRQSPIDAVGGYSSQDARNEGGIGWFSEVVDNFQSQPGWRIESLEFWGGYVSVDPGHTRGFAIRFYADNNGAVGPLLSRQDVAEFTEESYYVFPGQGWNGYHYTLQLGQPFSPPAAGSYWLSVVAILDRGGTAVEPQWGWVQTPTVVNQPPAMQSWFSPGTYTSQGIDMAFVLRGSTGSLASGACCTGSSCSVVLATACNTRNSRFAGPSTACNAPDNQTTPCCRADFNQSHGAVEPTVQDVFDFLTAYFTSDTAADVNASGGAPTLQDVFDYLGLFFAGCG